MEKLSSLAKQIKEAFEKENTINLKSLADNCTKFAVVEDNKLYAELACISYALYKILTKRHIVESLIWKKASKVILSLLQEIQVHAEENKMEQLAEDLKKIINSIYEVDERLGHYAQNIFDKARIKQASTAYAYGVSLSRAATLFNVLKKDLQEYIGRTTMHDEIKEKFTIKERLKKLKEMLGE